MKIYLLGSILLAALVLLDARVQESSFNDVLVNKAPRLVQEDSLHDVVIHRVARGIHNKKKDGDCRYKKGPWSECDTTNVQKKTLTLKRGDNSCEQTKVMTRKCKKACKYDKGDWSDCEASSNTRVRTDSLKPKSDSSCQPTRTLSKKCKKVCKYNKQAAWSDCDDATSKKTKVLVLKVGNSQICEASKKITKPCHKSSGHGGHKMNKGRPDYEDE